MEEDDKGCPIIRMGVSGWMFLLVPAYRGCPGPKAVKQLCVCVLQMWTKQMTWYNNHHRPNAEFFSAFPVRRDNQSETWFKMFCSLIRSQTLFSVKDKVTQCKKVAHTRLPSVWFWSWSQFLAVSLQVTWVINPVVGCHYFPPGLQLPSQPLRGLLPISLLGEQRHNVCEQFA